MNNPLKVFYALCSPAKLYILFSLMSTGLIIVGPLRGKKAANNKKNIIMFFLGACIWTYILNAICSDGWDIISWVLVLTPFIITFITMIGLLAYKKI